MCQSHSLLDLSYGFRSEMFVAFRSSFVAVIDDAVLVSTSIDRLRLRHSVCLPLLPRNQNRCRWHVRYGFHRCVNKDPVLSFASFCCAVVPLTYNVLSATARCKSQNLCPLVVVQYCGPNCTLTIRMGAGTQLQRLLCLFFMLYAHSCR